MSLQERFAAMFAAIDDDGRRYVMAVLGHEHDRVQATRRPVLRLVRGGQPAAALPTPSHAPVRINSKEA